MKSLRSRLLAVFVVAGLVFGGATAQVAFAKKPYPSQEEVLQARRNVATKKAMVERLQGIIADLTTEQVAMERTAMIKAEKYN
jgi:hypothetical protein